MLLASILFLVVAVTPFVLTGVAREFAITLELLISARQTRQSNSRTFVLPSLGTVLRNVPIEHISPLEFLATMATLAGRKLAYNTSLTTQAMSRSVVDLGLYARKLTEACYAYLKQTIHLSINIQLYQIQGY
jgi:hypothetical protein